MNLRDVCGRCLDQQLSRRDLVSTLTQAGIGVSAAVHFADALASPGDAEPSTRMRNVTGGQISCETLKLWGVDHVFGNTGAYEAGFVDALVDYPDIKYVLGLHEGPVVAMADGYARITGKTAFVNVHSITGTANALGLIVNAWADSSPLVISVGFSANSGENLGVFTETTKIEAIPELFTKLSFRSSQIENIGESMRRALQLASLLPSGPVFLGVTADVWSDTIGEVELIPSARSRFQTRLYPDESAIADAARLLREADNPLLIAGAELPRWGGLDELRKLADRLGATVSGDTAASRSSLGFPTDHPRYLGALRRPIESENPFDVVVLAGASRLSLARGGHPLIPTNAKIIEFGLREDHIARRYPADLIIYAHPEVTLEKLNDALSRHRIGSAELATRKERGALLKARRREKLEQTLNEVWKSDPIAPERLAAEIDRNIAPDAVVVTEGVSSDQPIWDYVAFDQVGGGRQHLISSGGSLGWGLGAAIGARLGAPERQVIALLGDGSYQFAVQALWTAARFRVPLLVVIFNNRAYQANRWALAGLKGRAAQTGHYIGIDLSDPDIDHVGIAKAYGLDGERVEKPDAIAAALKRGVQAERSGRGYVIDVVVARRGGGSESSWHETYDTFQHRN